MHTKTVFITGATSGIGYSCVSLFIKNNFKVIATGRRIERLNELEEKFGTENLFTAQLDVRDRQKVEQFITDLPKVFSDIDVLINNAGLALGLAPFQTADYKDFEQMIDTNIKGLLFVTQAVVNKMIEKKSGHIINIASIAGKESYASGHVYCATKAAVDSFSRSLRIDLLPFNIKVTNIAPGMTETEFSIVRFKGDENKAGQTYKGIEPLNADDIAEIIFFAATRPGHVNLNDIVITPTQQANATTVIRNL